jgi:general secretion pathway protein M
MVNISLNRREKIAVYAAGIFVVGFLFFQLVISPLFESRAALENKLSSRQEELFEMRQWRTEYRQLQHNRSISEEQFDKRPANFTLFSFLDQLAGRTGIKAHVSYMKPSSLIHEQSGINLSRVEMELQSISLKDLARYLYHVETSENIVIVKRLSISRKSAGESLIDAVLQVETVEA